MSIHIIRFRANKNQLNEMLEALGTYIKIAVDVQRNILVGGGSLHADCGAVLLDDGSRQEDVWGADWIPATGELRCEARINIRPQQNNPAMEILDSSVRDRIKEIVQHLLEGV